MKKILLVFTGGTIGSQAKDGTINTTETSRFTLLQWFAERNNEHEPVSFKTLQPLQILSENLTPQHWSLIIAAIEQENIAEFDGIIVTHGTDTLAFSAAALGIYFNHLPIPLLLVSSDMPLDHPQANGLANFCCAVAFICRTGLGGVFVAYKNPGQNMHIYLATRLASCLQLSSDFIGVQSKTFMLFEDNEFKLQDTLADTTRQQTRLKPDFSATILLIRPYPGLDYSHFNLTGIQAVLHDLYHSGTACTASVWDENCSLTNFIQHCQQLNLSIYLAPSLQSENTYSSTRELLTQGAKMIWNMSIEAAYAKLILAYGNFDEQQKIDQFLQDDIFLEHLNTGTTG